MKDLPVIMRTGLGSIQNLDPDSKGNSVKYFQIEISKEIVPQDTVLIEQDSAAKFGEFDGNV